MTSEVGTYWLMKYGKLGWGLALVGEELVREILNPNGSVVTKEEIPRAAFECGTEKYGDIELPGYTKEMAIAAWKLASGKEVRSEW